MKPVITFNPQLPITAHVEQIAELIKTNQVVIVAGETGSGKTTQLPKICLALGRKRIGHTQPRRLAARSVAERIASEMQVPLGDLVGYQVRFAKQTAADTRIKVMTDGILLAEITKDRLLRRYDTIIIDEAHERSLNIDFLLGYLKQLIAKRPELKVIITSATIDTDKFAAHFNDAPVISVAGRLYPVEMRYRPLLDQVNNEPIEQADGIVAAVKELTRCGPGDILVFCSGEREIKDAAAALASADNTAFEVLPLHARLSAAEQAKIFLPHEQTRVILATNIAETSLTVPGIRYVVDAGTARIARFSARSQVQRLPIEKISQASANQRAGRCGRLGPGICIRLYGEEDFLSREAFTEPEILRTNLAQVILLMAKAKLGQIQAFPFLTPPKINDINQAIKQLGELGALRPAKADDQLNLTKIGQQLADLPLDPRLGRMLLEASQRGCLTEVLIIVSFLAIQDLRERPAENQASADQLHARFFTDQVFAGPAPNQPAEQSSPAQLAPEVKPILRHTPHTSKTARWKGLRGEITQNDPVGEVDSAGDFAVILRIWRYLNNARRQLSNNQFRKKCRAEFLNYLRYREWQDLHTQLKDFCQELHLERNKIPGEVRDVLISILAGSLSQVGMKVAPPPMQRASKQRRPLTEYLGTSAVKFAIQPGSSLAKQPPEFLVAFELINTSRLWATTVAAIEPDWLMQVGAHLIKRQYGEPYWSASGAAVLCTEKISLRALPIISDRVINYAKLDQAEARQIFIRKALVEGQWQPTNQHANHDFLTHNAQVVAAAQQMADRNRGQSFIIDDDDIFAFYNDKIAPQVVSGASFDRWWRQIKDRSYLEFDLDLLIHRHSQQLTRQEFPDRWQLGSTSLPINYLFEPGAQRDGVVVQVPLALLAGLDPAVFSWQVPGLRAELAVELIRSLPKAVRTKFVPAPEYAQKALDWLDENPPADDQKFSHALGQALRALTGEKIAENDWCEEKLANHLRVGFSVVKSGKEVSFGRDLAKLQRELAVKVSQTITQAAPKVVKSTSWTFGELPVEKAVHRNGLKAIGYPALSDEGDGVSVVLADAKWRAEEMHRRGLRRLLVLVNPDPTRWAISHLSNTEKFAIAKSCYASSNALLKDAWLKAGEQCAANAADITQVRDQRAFEILALEVRQNQADQLRKVVHTSAQTIELANQLTELAQNNPIGDELLADLGELYFDGFISFTPDPWFDRLPKYLQANIARAQLAQRDPNREAQLIDPYYQLRDEYDAICEALPQGLMPAEIDQLAFSLEELKIQLFTQRLGTLRPISAKRINHLISEIKAKYLSR